MARSLREYSVVGLDLVREQLVEVRRSHGEESLRQISAIVEKIRTDGSFRKDAFTLSGALKGLHSVVSGRFRVVFRVAPGTRTIYVVGVGTLRHSGKGDVLDSLRRSVTRGELRPHNLL